MYGAAILKLNTLCSYPRTKYALCHHFRPCSTLYNYRNRAIDHNRTRPTYCGFPREHEIYKFVRQIA